jgi:heme O synthase-like polyprenyltransferase
MKKIKKYIPLALTFTPMLAMAATLVEIVTTIQNIVTSVIPLVIGIALIYFVIGVIKYIGAGGEEEKRKEGRNMMVYGIIGLFVIVCVWGLVNVLASTFNVGVGGTIDVPKF